MTTGGIPVSVSRDPFTAGSLAKLTWFLRDRIRDAIAAGHPHARQLHDSVEDAVRGILDYIDQAAHTADPLTLAPARVRAHALWSALQTAADFWHDHPQHPDHTVTQTPKDPRRVYAAAS
ncbi:hypothetical protein [Streptacidiphilus jiangxiensis]|uniref:Uncharacterized protein n=1 Tax=Streptacidiphilus jiangxiensis TaxID=235985 RepID=A0A1H7H052_STRJI|nr:hypothetical protein [Streptacidiphilus jiangxiensis]SEK43638.1 hypothetical protein SAMN05414137_10221 [Streptacidiphilus jiangxiensis]